MITVEHVFAGPYVTRTVVSWPVPLAGQAVDDATEALESAAADLAGGNDTDGLKDRLEAAEHENRGLHDEVGDLDEGNEKARALLGDALAWFEKHGVSIPEVENLITSAISALKGTA